MEGLVGLIILIISVVGWVANAINEQKARPPRNQQGGGRPRPQRRLQDEIESFLKEVQQQQGGQQKPQAEAPRERADERRAKPQRRAEKQPKPLRDQERRPAVQETTRRPPKPTRKPRRRKQESERSPLSDPGSLSAAGSPSAGSDQDVARYLQAQFQQTPNHELRDLLTPEQLSALRSMARNQSNRAGGLSVAQMLGGDNIRNAFVINEILQRPRSLR